ncbi:hypothetical protein MHLP_03265 [Candidatus Mycoplasma haematolamae str. Purdue]|uniref:Uncharacterized protein n=1 Tax=Mycoplasma haematolamae (strain Purdue) TaxID=1212765 RepID=I7BK34_MYCHA|nr:hypothetical protein [Candidatus Mycoplasma haematolamae]AFO52233.1 hypothetical protein MHLP_03265 [Candidatus Mycoplasma haematolamae str. Purdue]
MFTFAKFVSSALGFITVGSTGAVVAPAALDSPIYQSQDKLKSHWDLQPLRDSEQKLEIRLDSLKAKLLLALKATEAAKKFKHNLMQEKFESVKKEETNLKSRYEELTKKIEKISDLLRQQSQESSKKLRMQSAVSLLESYEKYFDKLIEHFEKQEKTILEIVCTIDRTSNPSSGGSQQSQESECATAEWIKKLKESESSSSAGAGGGISLLF